VRYLGGLDERIAHVVELHPYTTLDELSSLAHKVELQKRAKGKSETSKPPVQPYPSQRPTYSTPKPLTPSNPKPPPPTAPKTAPQTTSNPRPKENRRCFSGVEGLVTLPLNSPIREWSPWLIFKPILTREWKEQKKKKNFWWLVGL